MQTQIMSVFDQAAADQQIEQLLAVEQAAADQQAAAALAGFVKPAQHKPASRLPYPGKGLLTADQVFEACKGLPQVFTHTLLYNAFHGPYVPKVSPNVAYYDQLKLLVSQGKVAYCGKAGKAILYTLITPAS